MTLQLRAWEWMVVQSRCNMLVLRCGLEGGALSGSPGKRTARKSQVCGSPMRDARSRAACSCTHGLANTRACALTLTRNARSYSHARAQHIPARTPHTGNPHAHTHTLTTPCARTHSHTRSHPSTPTHMPLTRKRARTHKHKHEGVHNHNHTHTRYVWCVCVAGVVASLRLHMMA